MSNTPENQSSHEQQHSVLCRDTLYPNLRVPSHTIFYEYQPVFRPSPEIAIDIAAIERIIAEQTKFDPSESLDAYSKRVLKQLEEHPDREPFIY